MGTFIQIKSQLNARPEIVRVGQGQAGAASTVLLSLPVGSSPSSEGGNTKPNPSDTTHPAKRMPNPRGPGQV